MIAFLKSNPHINRFYIYIPIPENTSLKNWKNRSFPIRPSGKNLKAFLLRSGSGIIILKKAGIKSFGGTKSAAETFYHQFI